MELHQLRYFVAVAETGSFTRAAEREGVTQPTLSEQIIRLEAKDKGIGRRLFDRLGRKVVLTDAGQVLLAHAQSILAAVGEAERAVHDSGEGGKLRIGAIPTIAPFLLPASVIRFRRLSAAIRGAERNGRRHGSPFIRLPRKWEVREWLFGIYLTHRLSLKNSCVSLLKLGLLSPFFLITSFRNGANTIRQAGFCNYSLLLFSLFSSPFYEQFSSEKHLNLTTVRQKSLAWSRPWARNENRCSVVFYGCTAFYGYGVH